MAAVIDTGMATVKVCVLVWGEDKHSTGESASDVLLVDVGVGVEGGGHGGKGHIGFHVWCHSLVWGPVKFV